MLELLPQVPNDPSRASLRVALISPKGPLYRHRGGIFGKGLRYKPLTLPTLVALAPPELGARFTCWDEGIQDVPESLDADLVGLTVITGNAARSYELAARFRAQGKTVVLGGPHVTLVPEDAAPHADAIVVGYAEDTWPQLLRDFVAGRLQARYDQADGIDIGGRPLPDRSVLPRSKYLTEHVFEASRGCIHECEFCVVPSAWGRKPYLKPPAEIVEDLRRMRTRKALFLDLNIIADKEWARSLFTALIPLGIQWYGLATTLLCHDEALLDLAARSGCRGLLMGLESISEDALRRAKKGFNRPEDFVRVVERLHQRNIALQGCFVFGSDDDDATVFERTATFAVDAGIDLPRFAIATPFPGTALYKRLDAEGRILTRDWNLYDAQHVVFQPKKMSVQELQEGTTLAWKTAYSWGAMAKRLRRTAAPWHVAAVTNLGYRYYAHRLDRFYTCDSGMA
jgi:radical SAM superfamily enzyme YgiQ (UPF0313 family)